MSNNDSDTSMICLPHLEEPKKIDYQTSKSYIPTKMLQQDTLPIHIMVDEKKQ